MQPINIYNSQDVKVTIDENGTPVDVYVNGGLATSVLFYADYASLPAQGEGGILYVTEDTNFIYRWDGAYVQVGGGAASLQDVTDVGNTTTNDIQLINDADVILGAGGKVLMDNGSKLQEGTTDAGNGGSKGIALKCSVDYELKWEAGRLYTMEQDGFTIREVSHNFTFAPSVTDDDSKGFVIGSRWILDNGDIYTCTDATTGAAVWELNVISWGDIQGTLSYQTDLQTALDGKVDENSAITGATKTKITYDSKGLVTSGADAGISDITGLQTALDGKVPYTGATGNVNLGEYGVSGGYYQFDTTPTTYTQAVGNVGWNDTEGTIETLLKGGSVVLEIGQKLVSRVVNGTGGNVLRSNYQVVKVTGAQGQRLQVNLAQGNNDANSADTLGLIAENISNNQSGFIVTSGIISEINTTGSLQSETWADGDPLYLSPTTAGKVTNVKPQAPNHTVIIGFVVYAHSVHGKIFVKIDNGYELDELHNVKINTPLNGQVLRYNGTTFVWENSNDSDNLTFNAPLSRSVNAISISQASASASGYLSSTDWSTFNSKEPALTKGNLTESTSSVLTISGGSSAVIGSGTTIQVKQASSTQNGFLSSTDWSTFNGKESALTFSAPLARATNTISIPVASGSANGYLSSTDWTTFNNKQNALTNPVTGTGTNNEIAYFNTTGSTIGSLSTATYPSLTELSYVKGVTSSIQTQLNGKQATLTNPITGTGTSGQVAYFNGTTTQTGSATFTFSPTAQLLVNNSITASSAIARGVNLTPTLIAAANNDVLIGLDINPTFTNGAFTGVKNVDLRIGNTNPTTYSLNINVVKSLNGPTGVSIKNSNSGSSAQCGYFLENDSNSYSGLFKQSSAASAYKGILANDLGFYNNISGDIAIFNEFASGKIKFTPAGSSSPQATLFSTGNLAIGTTTDSGYKLDVNGTARVQNDLTISDTYKLTWGNNNYIVGNNSTTSMKFYIGAQLNMTLSTTALQLHYTTTVRDLIPETDNTYSLGQQFKRFNNGWFGGSVKIGSATAFNASAKLQVESTTQGFLPPVMTGAQRDAISTPAAGLIVYQSTNNALSLYNGTAWSDILTTSNYDGLNIAFGTTTGTKIGTATSQKIGFWNATPIVQPTTAVAASTLVSNLGTPLTDTDTFDGYTLKQIVKALRNTGILA